MNHFLTFDKDSDKCVGKSEFGTLQNDLGDSFPIVFESHDMNGDGKLQFEELYDAASTACYKSLELLYTNYMQSFGSQQGAQVAKATEKIGFAKEKLGQPSAMLQLYFEDIRKFGNNPNNLGVDDILKKYCEKYQYYEDRFGQTLEILENYKPLRCSFFLFTDRKELSSKSQVRSKRSSWTAAKVSPIYLRNTKTWIQKSMRKLLNLEEEFSITQLTSKI